MLSEIRDYADDTCTPDAVSCSVKLTLAFTLPRVDIEVFDENPTMFRSFITLFDEWVDKVTGNVHTKFTRFFNLPRGRQGSHLLLCYRWMRERIFASS